MSKLIAYRNTERHCFCKIKFRSRERILVSVASTPEHSIKVFKLIAGIFPLKTIWEYKATASVEKEAHKELITLLLGQTEKKVDHPLDAVITKLVPCRSCSEAARILRRAEQEASRVAS
jgi:hypothetical protein